MVNDEGNSYEARRVRRSDSKEKHELNEATASHPRNDEWMARISKRIGSAKEPSSGTERTLRSDPPEPDA